MEEQFLGLLIPEHKFLLDASFTKNDQLERTWSKGWWGTVTKRSFLQREKEATYGQVSCGSRFRFYFNWTHDYKEWRREKVLSVELVADCSSSSVALSHALSTSGFSVSLSTFRIHTSLKFLRYLGTREEERVGMRLIFHHGELSWIPLINCLCYRRNEHIVHRDRLDADRHSVEPL